MRTSKDNQRSIDPIETMTLVGAILGTGTAIFLNQFSYATIPLSLHAAALSATQRRRAAVTRQLEMPSAHLPIAAPPDPMTPPTLVQNMPPEHSPAVASLAQTHLNQTTRKLKEIQQWQREFQVRDWQTITEQVAQQQAQLADLSDRIHQLASPPSAVAPKPRKPLSLKRFQPLQATVTWAKVPHRPEKDRVIIFIDASNLYHAAKDRATSKHGVSISYRALVHRLRGNSQHCHTIVYTSVKSSDAQQVNFLHFLRRQGFLVSSKEVIQRSDGTTKGNLDVELAIDFVQLMAHYDTAILVSGDGDFLYAVNQAQAEGKRVEVASFSSHTSAELAKVADAYLNLEDVIDELTLEADQAA